MNENKIKELIKMSYETADFLKNGILQTQKNDEGKIGIFIIN
jgi:hypothetical protein